MASAQTKTIFSEDEFGRKLDRCVTDTLIKGGKTVEKRIVVPRFIT